MNVSDDDIAQISILCPGTDEEIIRHDLSITNDVNLTINRILDGNVTKDFVNGDEDLPLILSGSKPRNSERSNNIDKVRNLKSNSNNIQNKDMESGRNNKLSIRSDFLSDGSDIENDIEIIEPLSLKDRLLQKQGSCNGTTGSYSGLINNMNKNLEDCIPLETVSDLCLDNVINIDKPCSVEESSETSSYTYESCTLSERLSPEIVHSSKANYLEDSSKTGVIEKSTKRKRTPEEIEEKKRQAQAKKEANEQKKLEREKQQVEKKKNMQIRKIEGERKKQMGAWNQSLEFMKIVVDPHIINECGLGAAIFKAAEDLKIPCLTEEQGLPFTISWKRTVTEWIENGSQVDAVKKDVTEDDALTVIPMSDFVQMVENSKQGIQGKTTLQQYLQLVKQRQPGITLTPVVIGMEKYFRDLKTIKQRQHREAVLATGQSSENTKKKNVHVDTIVSRLDVEEACTETQLFTGCTVQMLETPEEITDLVRTYTKAVAEKPAKKDRLNSIFSFHEDGTTGVKVDKSGHGLLKVWKQQLLQFKNVSPDIADAIISEYPSPRLLMKAYSRCSSLDEGVKILENILVRRGAGVLETTRRVGKEMSRRFYLFFNSTDPSFVIK